MVYSQIDLKKVWGGTKYIPSTMSYIKEHTKSDYFKALSITEIDCVSR